MRRYYQVLGVSEDADEAQIKQAYRRKASETHPDTHPDDPDAAEKFKEVKEAYECLSDPERRQIYDETGDTSVETGNPAEDLLLNILNDVIDNHDLMCEVIARTRHVIEQMIAECEDRKVQAEETIVKLEAMRTKFLFKGKGANLISGVFDSKLEGARAELDELATATAAAKGVYDMLKEYIATDKPAMWTDVHPTYEKLAKATNVGGNFLAGPKSRRRGGFPGTGV